MKAKQSTLDPELVRYAEEVMDWACTKFPMGYRPPVVWKGLRVSAGLANYNTKSISLSRYLLIDRERIRRTLLHEYAHLLAFHRHGRAGVGHGAGWRKAMLDLGLPPEVYHHYECQRNKPKQQVKYQCSRCGELILRSRKFAKGRIYLHRTCLGRLKFVGIEKPQAKA